MEIWKPVVGFDGYYEVSNEGRVRSLDRYIKTFGGGSRPMKGRVLKHHINRARHGYRTVMLVVDQIEYRKYVHHLVLEAFVGTRPEGSQGCHNDSDVSNNALNNLRWDTPKANNADRLALGRQHCGEDTPSSKLTTADVLEIKRRAKKEFHKNLAVEYGVSRQQIDKIVQGRQWAHLNSEL